MRSSPRSERAVAHLRIGRLLAARTTRGGARREDLRHREPVRSRRGADHDAGGARAGRRAQPAWRASAPRRRPPMRSALQYFAAGRALLAEDGWEAVLPAHLRSRAQPGRVRVSDRGAGVGGRTALGAVRSRRDHRRLCRRHLRAHQSLHDLGPERQRCRGGPGLSPAG